MSTRRKIAIGIGGCLLIALITFAPLPTWVSVVIAVLIAAVLTLLVVQRPASIPQRVYEPLPVPPPPPGDGNEDVKDVLLPSSRPDYRFRFAATVVWSPMTEQAGASGINLGALAVDVILRRAQDITKDMDPERVTLAQYELASELGRTLQDDRQLLKVMAESVRLKLSDGDHERLEKLATVRKEKEVWEHERAYEKNRRTYLSDDVLKDPGSTVVWWLARNDDEVKKTVDDIGVLAQLFSAANNGEGTGVFDDMSRPAYDHSAVEHLANFISKAGFPDGGYATDLYIRRIADITDRHDPELAAEIRSRFDIQVMDAEEDDSDSPDDPLPFGSNDEPGSTV